MDASVDLSTSFPTATVAAAAVITTTHVTQIRDADAERVPTPMRVLRKRSRENEGGNWVGYGVVGGDGGAGGGDARTRARAEGTPFHDPNTNSGGDEASTGRSNVEMLWQFALALLGAILIFFLPLACLVSFCTRRRVGRALGYPTYPHDDDMEVGIPATSTPSPETVLMTITTHHTPPPPHHHPAWTARDLDTTFPITPYANTHPKQSDTTNNVDDSPDSCAICLDAFKDTDPVRQLRPCGHCFHPSCIGEWVGRGSGVCPMCRVVLHVAPG
ncbi:hypothetical protein HK104_005872 [Borealophlyctis nickersoniae]|nr:hypothetical protein HK104_005872 [Borealophlyctis nickersoniae]